MKKNLFVLFVALTVLVTPNIVSAGEPKPDLSGEISPSQSWILHTNKVWKLPEEAADLKISPVDDAVKVEIERTEINITAETDVPGNNPDITDRRIKPINGDVYLWSTSGTYKIMGWAPVGGIAVVKTGPLGAAGQPPPGNVTPEVTPKPEVTLTPPEPTLTPVPLTPEPTPVPPAPVPPVAEVKFALREDDSHLLVTYDGGQNWEDLGSVQGAGPTTGDVANALKADQAFVDSLRAEPTTVDPGTVADNLKADQEFLDAITPGIDYDALVADLKADQAFVDSLRPAEAMIVTPRDVVTDVGKYLITHYEADLKGEQGPPGPGISDILIWVILAAAGLSLVGIALGAWNIYYNRGLPDYDWVETALENWASAIQTKIDTAVGVAKDGMNKKISDCATADSVRRAITDLEQKISGLVELTQDYATKTQMVEAIRALQFQLEQQIARIAATSDQTKGHLMLSLEGLKEQLATLEAEIAPLAPRPVTFDSAGNPRCPGCKIFVKRIPIGISGRCLKCGVAYVIPAPDEEPPVMEVAEVAAEGTEAS